MGIENLQESRAEWEAWQSVVNELLELGIDINFTDGLADALRTWGERLAVLRASVATPVELVDSEIKWSGP